MLEFFSLAVQKVVLIDVVPGTSMDLGVPWDSFTWFNIYTLKDTFRLVIPNLWAGNLLRGLKSEAAHST